MKKILIAYYSKTGNTKKIAEAIGSRLHADYEEVIDLKKRSGIFGVIFAGRDAIKEKETTINETEMNPSEYEVVIIGTPVWGSHLTPAMRTYLNKYKRDIKNCAVIASSGGPENERVYNDVTKIVGKELLAGIGISSNELKDEEHIQRKIGSFVEIINGMIKE